MMSVVLPRCFDGFLHTFLSFLLTFSSFWLDLFVRVDDKCSGLSWIEGALYDLNSEKKVFLLISWTVERQLASASWVFLILSLFSGPSLCSTYFTHCPGSSWKKSSRASNPNVYYLVARYHMIDVTVFQFTSPLQLVLVNLYSKKIRVEFPRHLWLSFDVKLSA